MVYVIQVCWQLASSKPVWHIPLLCVQWKIPDDGQRNCQKHAECYSKNTFAKLVHLVGVIISICGTLLYIGGLVLTRWVVLLFIACFCFCSCFIFFFFLLFYPCISLVGHIVVYPLGRACVFVLFSAFIFLLSAIRSNRVLYLFGFSKFRVLFSLLWTHM